MKLLIALILSTTILFINNGWAGMRQSGEPNGGKAAESETNLTLLIGQRNLEDDWKPVEDQPLFGFEADFATDKLPVNILIGYSRSSESGTMLAYDYRVGSFVMNVKGTVSEFFVGIRKYLDTGSAFRPYGNAGVSFVSTEFSGSALGVSVSDSGSSTGLFFGGGAKFLFNSFSLGLDFRMLTGTKVEMYGADLNADYTQFALVLGYSFFR